MCDVEKTRRKNGWAEEPEENASRNKVVADVLSPG